MSASARPHLYVAHARRTAAQRLEPAHRQCSPRRPRQCVDDRPLGSGGSGSRARSVLIHSRPPFAHDPIDLGGEQQHVHYTRRSAASSGGSIEASARTFGEVGLIAQHLHRQVEGDDAVEPLDEMPGAEAGTFAELDQCVAGEPAAIERAEDRGLTLRGGAIVHWQPCRPRCSNSCRGKDESHAASKATVSVTFRIGDAEPKTGRSVTVPPPRRGARSPTRHQAGTGISVTPPMYGRSVRGIFTEPSGCRWSRQCRPRPARRAPEPFSECTNWVPFSPQPYRMLARRASGNRCTRLTELTSSQRWSAPGANTSMS